MDTLKVGLTTQYSGVTVEYLEDVNKWRFELRGRERRADSLSQAKEWIDKPEPVKKSSKTFKRFEALHCGGWASLGYHKKNRNVVTVTSAAHDTFRGTNTPSAAWILNGTERTKEPVERLFEISPENAKKWEQYDSTKEEIERLEKVAAAILQSIKRIDLSKYVDSPES